MAQGKGSECQLRRSLRGWRQLLAAWRQHLSPRISSDPGLPTAPIATLHQLQPRLLATTACSAGGTMASRIQAAPACRWPAMRSTAYFRSITMPQRGPVSRCSPRRCPTRHTLTRCSSAEAAATEAWVTATGVPIFQRMMAKGLTLQVCGLGSTAPACALPASVVAARACL